jgi:cyanophycinase-like exopeptidase
VSGVPARRPAGGGWLVLVGGGEFSFGETLDADAAWLELAAAEAGGETNETGEAGEARPVGFVPAASGSVDYGHHFADYLEGELGALVEVIPIYRQRDARRGKNLERIAECAAVYLGGGVADHLLDALAGQPAADALLERLRGGGTVVAIAAAAQALGAWVRSIEVGEHVPGLGWLPGGAVEPNFDPGHDRRLRQLMAQPGVSWGVGLPAGSALLLGPDGAVETVGTVYWLERPDGELHAAGEEAADDDDSADDSDSESDDDSTN